MSAYGFMARMMLTRAPDLEQWERSQGHPLLADSTLAMESPEWRKAAEQEQLLFTGPTGRIVR
jgi:hypothetical protein